MKNFLKIGAVSFALVAGLGLFAACGNTDEPETYDYTVKAGESIQAVIDEAQNGDKILVKAGTYNEELTVDGKELSIVGEGDVIIAGPEDYSGLTLWEREEGDTTGHAPQGMYGIVRVLNGANLKLQGVQIKGDVEKASSIDLNAGRYTGVLVVNSDVVLKQVKISDIILQENMIGVQTGYGLYVGGANASNVTVENCEVKNIQKGGIYALTTNSNLVVKDTLIEGIGDTDKIAQNGIWAAGTASVSGCTIKGFNYTPEENESVGIALNTTLTAQQVEEANTFENVEMNVYVLNAD